MPPQKQSAKLIQTSIVQMRDFKFRSHGTSEPVRDLTINKRRWNAKPHMEVPHKMSLLLVSLSIMWQYEALISLLF